MEKNSQLNLSGYHQVPIPEQSTSTVGVPANAAQEDISVVANQSGKMTRDRICCCFLTNPTLA